VFLNYHISGLLSFRLLIVISKHKRQRVENAGAPAVQNVAGGVSGKSAAENNDDMMEWE
jgi:hypothetical protein